MKNFDRKKLFIAGLALATITGTSALHAMAKKVTKDEYQQIWSDERNDPFVHDIFVQMTEMEKQMQKTFEEHRKLMEKMHEEAQKEHKSINASKAGLALFSDESSYRYELTFSSFKKEDVAISINNRILTISAQNKKSENDKKKKLESHISNNFYYSLSLPVDAAEVPEIERHEGKIIVKFAKESGGKKEVKEEVRKK